MNSIESRTECEGAGLENTKLERRMAAIVTVPFWANTPDGMRFAMCELLRFCLGWIIVVFDERSPKGPAIAQDIFNRYKDEAADKGTHLIQQATDHFDTGPRWRVGIKRALKEPGCEAVFVFPGDLKVPPTVKQLEENRQGWSHMLDEAARNDLVIGDYTSHDDFKTVFDKLLGHPITALLFPDLAPSLKAKGHSKLRSEVFIIRRSAFRYAEDCSGFGFGTDPTLQLTLAALQGHLRVTPEWFGTLTDDDQQRKVLGAIHQLFRFMSQGVVDRLVAEMQACTEAGEDQLPAARRLLPVLAEALRLTHAAMETWVRTVEARRTEARA